MESLLSITHVVELTPPGRAAVAVVLVAGPQAVSIVDACLYRADQRLLADLPLNRISLARWGQLGGEELIVCCRSNDSVEIHCHGGVAAVRAVVELLRARGCQPMAWQDWARGGVLDPIRAAAQVALADASTARTAAVLVDQLEGALAEAIRAALNDVAAEDWQAAAARIDAILTHRGVGLHLTTPWRVVLAGRPNVGKSSLMNALVGFQRAIVCDLPGTTRDVLTATTAIDGWPIELADTAGLRVTRDAIESAGVARASAAVERADLVLLVVDNAGEVQALDLPTSTPALRVLNKIDLRPFLSQSADAKFGVRTSALTGEGIADLVSAIGRALVPSPPAAGAAVPFTAEQIAQLDAARAASVWRDGAAATGCLQRLL